MEGNRTIVSSLLPAEYELVAHRFTHKITANEPSAKAILRQSLHAKEERSPMEKSKRKKQPSDDLYAEVHQSTCDKLLRSVTYPFIAFERSEGFPGCNRAALRENGAFYEYTKSEVKKMLRDAVAFVQENRKIGHHRVTGEYVFVVWLWTNPHDYRCHVNESGRYQALNLKIPQVTGRPNPI